MFTEKLVRRNQLLECTTCAPNAHFLSAILRSLPNYVLSEPAIRGVGGLYSDDVAVLSDAENAEYL